ncbi:MAG: radical SAM protein [Lachnospiraceae bacterium]|nr:radical SAM protein [Lachnospiraceae bacterium]
MESIKLPVFGYDRLRMGTDGDGVSTLVCSTGCTLRCRLCLNPACWDGSATHIREYTADELYDKLKIDNLYFLSTNGGVTFGGGEPLLNSEFIREFILKYQKTGWKFYLESSLNVPRENLSGVISLIDHFYIDVKDMDPLRYHEYTGGDFDVFYHNLNYLKDTVGADRITVKIPTIPYFHKADEAKMSLSVLKELGFVNLYEFDYVDTFYHKKISEKANENRHLIKDIPEDSQRI